MNTQTSLLTLIAIALAGCSSSQSPQPLKGVDRAEQFAKRQSQTNQSRPLKAAQTSTLDNPALAINGVVYSLESIAPRLAELAGSTVMREIVLEHAIEQELRNKRQTIADDLIDQERDRLLRAIQQSTGLQEQTQLSDIVLQARAARGLGPVRFNALAKRTASLRSLIKDEVVITNEALQLEYELTFGPRIQPRIISVPFAADAQRIKQQLSQQSTFALLAAKHSTDPSAERGGLIEPLSPLDPAYPLAMREALSQVIQQPISNDIPEKDRTLGPIALDNGTWLLLLPDSIIYPTQSPPFDQVIAELSTTLRERQERLLMARKAEQLIANVKLTPYHPSLKWARNSTPPAQSNN